MTVGTFQRRGAPLKGEAGRFSAIGHSNFTDCACAQTRTDGRRTDRPLKEVHDVAKGANKAPPAERTKRPPPPTRTSFCNPIRTDGRTEGRGQNGASSVRPSAQRVKFCGKFPPAIPAAEAAAPPNPLLFHFPERPKVR